MTAGRGIAASIRGVIKAARPSFGGGGATTTKRRAASCLLLLAAVSDPVVSAYEDAVGMLDENDSYWTMMAADDDDDDGGDGGGRSRNTNIRRPIRRRPYDDARPPGYSRVVVVGGGMAGLHTALALAERTRDPAVQGANPPRDDNPRHRRRWWARWPFGRTTTTTTDDRADDDDIVSPGVIVLDASRIGNGASGRAMGWIGHGYQVPHENILAASVDPPPASSPPAATSVPTLLRNAREMAHRLGLAESPPPEQYDAETANVLHELTRVAYDRVRDIVESYGIDCDWREGGVVHGSIREEGEGEGGVEGKEEDEDDGIRTLTSAQVNGIMGRPIDDVDGDGLYKGGIYDPNCGSVNPLRLTLGLADAVERWGVRIYENTKVVKVERKEEPTPRGVRVVPLVDGEGEGGGRGYGTGVGEGRYAVVTDRGHVVRCDHVVLCTGASTLSSDVSRRLSRSFLPFYTYMTATEPLRGGCPMKDGALEDELSRDGGPRDVVVVDYDDDEPRNRRPASLAVPTYGDDHLILNYWRRNGLNDGDGSNDDGRVLFGSLGDTYPLPAWLVSYRLRNALSEVYPQLRDVRFDRVWGGKLAFSPNSLPLIGRDVDFDDDDDDDHSDSGCGEIHTMGGVWYATAFAGHGIIPTAVAGSLIANAILGIPDQQQWKLFHTHFPPTSWNGYPFSRLSAGTVLSLYNAFDWLGKRGVPLPRLPDLW
ncbi:hypothetical protein ACHAW5_006812 [Stephanodiscus triporus]|uniref:FAD dependent oxidoreductase domain-containing protein n=1 Tax=Stephanodiscus triporus TaxID=2934178 RepID=A0ABD3QM54_9STRA